MDALVAKADEGRGRLRKMLRSCQQAVIQQYPNGAIHFVEIQRRLLLVVAG